MKNNVQSAEWLFLAIDNIVTGKIKQLKYNYTIEGTITEVIDTSTYKVDINGSIYTIKSINNNTYLINDIVIVEILNNNFSNKIILCKRP